MANYTYAQLEQIWIQAGGNPAIAPLAAAVAEAESSGNPNATNTNTNGSTDRGLWQINSVHGSQSTYDPLANARAAVSISKNGTNWTPWTTFNTGAYKRFLQSGTAPATGTLPGGGGIPTSGGATDTGLLGDPFGSLFSDLKQFVDQLFKTLFNWVLVALEIGIGLFLMYLGIYLFILNTKTAQSVGKAAAQIGAVAAV